MENTKQDSDEADRPALYSRCSVGKSKWFWVLWHTDDSWINGGEPFAYGNEETSADAEAKASEEATKSFPGRRVAQGSANLAHGFKRKLPAKKKAAQASPDSASVAPQECVYTHSYSDWDGSDCWTPYRIIKRTKKRVYVELRNHGSRFN